VGQRTPIHAHPEIVNLMVREIPSLSIEVSRCTFHLLDVQKYITVHVYNEFIPTARDTTSKCRAVNLWYCICHLLDTIPTRLPTVHAISHHWFFIFKIMKGPNLHRDRTYGPRSHNQAVIMSGSRPGPALHPPHLLARCMTHVAVRPYGCTARQLLDISASRTP
jgi:hypothetical protein